MRRLIAVFLMKLATKLDHKLYLYISDLSHEIMVKASFWNSDLELDLKPEDYNRLHHKFMSIRRASESIKDRLTEDLK